MRSRIDGWAPAATGRGDDVDFTCSATVEAPCDGELVFEGIATLATLLLDGDVVAESNSMWVPVRVPVTAGEHRVEVRCHALTPRLTERRKPRARWRQKVAYDGNLRWFRTTLIGRAPGFAPGPPVVGLWRPVFFEPGEPRRRGQAPGSRELWWPHTHGEPRPGGSRTIAARGDVLRDGLQLVVNGIDVFVRGAVWTPVPDEELRPTLEAARDAGLNMVRIPGWGAYESVAFWDLCDELGMLVWQDLMFANLDYPFEHLSLDAELDALVEVIGGRPSLAVVCGGSEVEQQVAMLGLDPALARPPVFAQLEALDAVYVPNAPCGVDRPLRPDDGVANWFGVGGYRRPLSDARAAGVRFASECLAFANVGEDGDLAGAMRDVDSPWDFMDVTRHYLTELYGADAPDDLLPYASGDAMAETFGEWRRTGSRCAGAIVLWLRDLAPGAGWGLLDHRGDPKAALAALAPVLAPVAVWTTDEGLAGIAVHVANDRPERLSTTLRVTLYRDGEQIVGEATAPVEVPGHGSWSGDVETLLGRWVDAAYAYRFGPPQHDLVVAALDDLGLASAREPAGRSAARLPADVLGIEIADGVLTSRRALLGARLAGGPQFVVEPGRPYRVRGEGPLTARNLAGCVPIP